MYTHTSTRTNTTAHAHTTLSLLSFLSFRRAKKNKKYIHGLSAIRVLSVTYSLVHINKLTRARASHHTYRKLTALFPDLFRYWHL